MRICLNCRPVGWGWWPGQSRPVPAGAEDNRNCAGSGFGRMYRRWRGLHGDDVHATADKFSREYRQPIDLVVRPAIYDRDAVPISVADFFQSLNERGDE